MHKLGSLAATAVLGLLLALPLGTEAKTVAVLPLVNNVAARQDLESIYFDRSFEVIHKQADLDFVDGQQLEDAVAKYTKAGVLPDKTALQSVADAANVDLVIVGDVERLERKMPLTTGDHKIYITLRGTFASYDRQTGTYDPHNFNENKKVDAALGSRWDLQAETWANMVTHECNRILGVKKLNVESPRLTKLK